MATRGNVYITPLDYYISNPTFFKNQTDRGVVLLSEFNSYIESPIYYSDAVYLRLQTVKTHGQIFPRQTK